jgi:hypothetical protein
MRTPLSFAVVCLACTALADDIIVRTTGALNHMVTVTTNQTRLPGPFWDGLDGGGHYEMTVQMVSGTVVVAEHTWASSKGIGSEIINTTRIPTNKIPYTFTVSQTTVTVSRAEEPIPEAMRKQK